jgi:hypothetical protein
LIRLDVLLAGLPFLAPLRPDELSRAATRFRVVDLAPGEKLALAATTPECALVLSGHVRVAASPIEGFPEVQDHLGWGDHAGVHALLAGRAFNGRLEAEGPARVALLDARGYEELLVLFPVIAVPACAALAEELAWKDDLLREVAAIRTEHLGPEAQRAAIARRRRRVARHLALRGSALAYYMKELVALVQVWLREPAFWMLGGFVGAFSGARAIVHWIFAHHAEKKLFNLHYVEGFENPIHIHHFNYGLALVTVASLLAFLPSFRQHLRAIGLFFGIGAGLIFDEFGLIWNLDPDYYQRLSWVAVALGALVLAELAFRRGAWSRRIRGLRHRGAR